MLQTLSITSITPETISIQLLAWEYKITADGVDQCWQQFKQWEFLNNHKNISNL